MKGWLMMVFEPEVALESMIEGGFVVRSFSFVGEAVYSQ